MTMESSGGAQAAKRIVTAALLFAAAACATGQSDSSPQPSPDDLLIVYPLPPDPPRIQFLAAFSDERDVVGEKGRSFLDALIGSDEDESYKTFNKPYGVAIQDGVIYVCDSMLPGLDVLDLNAKTFEYFVPQGPGKLRKPINCSVDRVTGDLYVADADRGQIVVFDSTGVYKDAFGEDRGLRPTDVFVDDQSLWVADVTGGAVHVYDKSTRRHVRSFPENESNGVLRQPTNLWVQDDRVYVSDFGDFSVKAYSREGRFLHRLGSYGSRMGQFTRPKGVAADRDGNVYVVDSGFENVQVFNRDGELLMFFGGPYQGPGDMWLPAQVIIDYDNLDYFRPLVHESFELKYLILVTNQYGPDRLNVYGFVEPRQMAQTEGRP
jgi:DNA-binding beta-propeller fold protein YncE